MKRPDISGWWNTRQVNKVRDQYKYNLMIYGNKHLYEKSSEDAFLIGGLIIYVALPIIAAYTGYYWLGDLAIFAFIAAVMFPFLASFWEQYNLAKKLTLTLNVVPDNPENTRPVRLRLQGVEFDAPMQSKKELGEYLLTKNAHLVHHISLRHLRRESKVEKTSVQDDESTRVEQLAKDKSMRLYPMRAKGDDVPSMVLFPDDPEKMLRARQEKVRLSFGIGAVRHATVYACECRPIRTSIEVKGKIIDVEYALFAPFFTQHDLDQWLETAEWFVPSRVAQEVATYVKQQADMTKNAAFFGTLEKQRDDASAAYDRLLLHQQFSDIQADVEGDVLQKFRPKRDRQELLGAIIAFAVGLMAGMLFF